MSNAKRCYNNPMRIPHDYLGSHFLRLQFPINWALETLNSPMTFFSIIVLTIACIYFVGAMGGVIFLIWLSLWILVRILAATLQALRSTVRPDHLIVVFRPFSDRNATFVRQWIVPAAACYGRVVLIADNSFARSSPYWKDKWFVPLQRGGVEPDEFADLQSLPTPNEDWKLLIEKHIKQASIAIVILDRDFVGPHLHWEITKSLELIGSDKLIALIKGKSGILAATELGLSQNSQITLGDSSHLPKAFFDKIETILNTPKNKA
ncbi:hypothetical protein [Mariprofundus ferrooxydans]|nr:hypothetical protein [Mariprofundus ferrooxydans]